MHRRARPAERHVGDCDTRPSQLSTPDRFRQPEIEHLHHAVRRILMLAGLDRGGRFRS